MSQHDSMYNSIDTDMYSKGLADLISSMLTTEAKDRPSATTLLETPYLQEALLHATSRKKEERMSIRKQKKSVEKKQTRTRAEANQPPAPSGGKANNVDSVTSIL